MTNEIPYSKKDKERMNYYNECIKSARIAKNKGIKIIIIGVKISDAGNVLMRELASQNDNREAEYYIVSNMGKFVNTFRAVMSKIDKKKQ